MIVYLDLVLRFKRHNKTFSKAQDQPVEVWDGDDLSSDVVVQPVDGVGVDEAVAGPKAGLHAFLDFAQNLTEAGLNLSIKQYDFKLGYQMKGHS